mmetsp:Transcript_86870/g.156473  ORF Transcript_86870/g.156473 Transcript_86870/m.156473 type:complete len:478 (-) Transcript_86870:97-1530(-)
MRRPEEVMLLADFFRGAEGSNGGAGAWIAFYDDEAAARLASIGLPPALPSESTASSCRKAALLASEPLGQALRLDPICGRLALRRTLPSAGGCAGRLHIKARFFDSLAAEDDAHWLGLSSCLGTCAVGIAPGIKETYCFLNGNCPNGVFGQYFGWQRSTVERTRGWHLFEVVLEEGLLTIAVDGENLTSTEAKGLRPPKTDEHLWLVAKSGGCGTWAAVQILHTPLGCMPNWELGGSLAQPAGRAPWEIRSEEYGRWEVDSDSIIWRLPELQEAPQGTCLPVEDVAEICSWPRKPATSLSSLSSVLTVDCWTKQLPRQPEFHERLDRAMVSFVERLQEAGLVVPMNLERVGQCGNQQHQGCYVYNFGTRKLHIQTREGGGRLSFVVRCGGGYLDFTDFVKRQGSFEQLKLQKLQASQQQGREVVRLLSIRSAGALCMKEWRPGSTASSQGWSRPSTSTSSLSSGGRRRRAVLSGFGL